MNIQPLVRVGRLLPLAAALAACSTSAEESPEAMGRTTPPVAQPGQPGAQGQGQEVADQRRTTLISESLREAEKALELKLWQDAARIAGQVLDLEPSNQRAREILFTAQELLGGQAPSVTRAGQDRELLVRVAAERDRDRARN